MGQRKKELIALKGAGLRKGGKPAKASAKVVYVPRYLTKVSNPVGRIKAIGNRVMVLKSGDN